MNTNSKTTYMGFYHCSSRSDFKISERDEKGIEQ